MNDPAQETFNPVQESASPAPDRGHEAPSRPGLAELLASQRSNLVILAMFLAGGGGLYLLSGRHGPAKASAQQEVFEAQVDTALKQYDSLVQTRSGATEDGGPLDQLYYDARLRQIPAGDLQANPFRFRVPPQDQPAVVPEKVELKSEPEGAEQYRQAVVNLQNLRLQSILSGSHGNVAMISNNLLSEGQVIQGWTVDKIEPTGVVLRWKDRTHTLKMPEP